jgi:DNA-binding transcriptional MerR regulator
MRVNQLATDLGVTSDTVRYYTRQGFLQPSKSPANGYKHYHMKDRTRLRFILSARQLGFSVSDIRKILSEADKGETPCPVVRRLIEIRLQEVEQRLSDTAILRDRMSAAIENWNSRPDLRPTGHMICHLIEEFANTVNDDE